MEVLQHVDWLLNYIINDDRFAANVTAIGVGLFLVLISWFLLQSLLSTLWAGVLRFTRNPSAKQVGEQIVNWIRNALWWMFVTASVGTIVFGCVYHLLGGDVGRQVLTAYEQVTPEHVARWVRTAILLGFLVAGTWYLLRVIRRLRPVVEQRTQSRIRLVLSKTGTIESTDDSSFVPNGMLLLERYAKATTVLISLLTAGRILEIGEVTTPPLGFALRVITVLVAAKLLTLMFRMFSKPLAGYGDRHFKEGRLNHYWERLGRLLPLGERCFEMAVYISAAALCVRELQFIDAVANSGEKLVKCIGIFFGTRVLIELLHVLLNELFGLYGDDKQVSQQARTLVPLLQSICQYTTYFGGGVWMLKVLGFPTEPILAGAGIIGLAVGLGAQNLVTDVVSGLFILFENQYLVGDYVCIGAAQGVVEAVAVRHTQIRDDQGKLHIIPNGQIKSVINYSKGFLFATVEVKVPPGANVDLYLAAMNEVGKYLRKTRVEVLADTQVQGIIGASLTETTVRAVTKVKPGFHQLIENEFRRLLKTVLDQQQGKAEPRLT